MTARRATLRPTYLIRLRAKPRINAVRALRADVRGIVSHK